MSLPESADNIVWPVVPDPIVNGQDVVQVDEENATVTLPYWFWLKVEIYIIKAEANIDKLQGKK